mmetsp:Transcript_9837/g.11364  ORF Transcript_9837/g.11364 Transcript_9837/m.11364 type:complete len:99 (-) Transcript_9837:730-1026(-)
MKVPKIGTCILLSLHQVYTYCRASIPIGSVEELHLLKSTSHLPGALRAFAFFPTPRSSMSNRSVLSIAPSFTITKSRVLFPLKLPGTGPIVLKPVSSG